jgi:acyl carrier protein
MNIRIAKDLVLDLVKKALEDDYAEIINNKETKVSENMPLIGSESALDSMKLVRLCLALEDKAFDSGFEFDWTSDTAMSTSRSMFRSVKSLAEEYVNQYKAQK